MKEKIGNIPLREDVPESVVRDGWDPEQLQNYCSSVLQSLFPDFRGGDVKVNFYPYIGLKHTLRRTQKGWIIRISDHCRHASAPVLGSIVSILGHKVMRLKPPGASLGVYERFRSDPEMEAQVRRRRERKGRKLFSNKAGRHHSLQKLYDQLNGCYFNGQIEIKRIGWGLRTGRARLGHYDPIHHTITLSPLLDSPGVPSFVVKYIVYHEMLHALFDGMPGQNSRRHHPRQFRHAESSYPDYERARKFLEQFNRRPRRNS